MLLNLPMQIRFIPYSPPALKEIKERKKAQNLPAGDGHVKYFALLCSCIWIFTSRTK